jgi:hypothetical protein
MSTATVTPSTSPFRLIVALIVIVAIADVISGGAVTQHYRFVGLGSGSNSVTAPSSPAPLVLLGVPQQSKAPDVLQPQASVSSPPHAPKAQPAADGALRYGARTTPTPIAPAADSGAGCFPVCAPLVMKHGELFVQRSPNATTEPELMRVSHMTPAAGGAGPYFAFPPTVKRVIVDIGTNSDPDSDDDYGDIPDIGMVWFEPQVTLQTHPLHLERARRSISLSTNRIAAFPAAVAPDNGHMMMHLSLTSGCSSLLPMNDVALSKPEVVGKNAFTGSDKAFKNYADAKPGFTNCISKNQRENKRHIPVVRGEAALKFIDPKLDIFFLTIDAQGFDLNVAASMGAEMARIDHVMLECQDLPEGHGLFLTKGSFSCADMVHCMQANLPHRLVAASTGEPANTCTTNSPIRERNCMFRRMDRPKLFKNPKIVDRPVFELEHPKRDNLVCPDFRLPGSAKNV